MKLALLLFILLASYCAPPAGTTTYVLFSQTPAGNMSAQEYNDRSSYIACLATTTTDMQFDMTNSSKGGPYSFHLKFSKTCGLSLNVYYLSLYALQKVKSGTSSSEIPIILLNSNTATHFDYYKSISLSDFESTAIPDPANNINDPNGFLTFRTQITFHFISTDVDSPVTYLKVDCPIKFKRPNSVTNSVSTIQTTMLTNSIAEVTIDISIDAKLEVCAKENTYPTLDYTSCSVITDGSKQSFPLNSPAKFQLSLQDTELKSLYYLTKFKVTLQNQLMTTPVDFTSMAKQQNTYQGIMIFSLTMSIVGDPITITASATMSSTVARRILQHSEGTKAAVSMITGSVKASSGSDTTTISSSNGLILSIWLISLGFFIMII